MTVEKNKSLVFWEKLKHLLRSKKAQWRLLQAFPNKQLEDMKKTNRQSLGKVYNWITASTLLNSNFNYGIEHGSENRLDLPPSDDTTYTDIICFLSDKLSHPIQYLEVGVSVGKNFWQLMNYFKNAMIVGIDIEELNPVIANKLVIEKTKSWGAPTAIKKQASSISSFSYGSNKGLYVSADEFDENAWNELRGKRFNVYFSDALHDPKALWHEYQMLKKFELLDRNEIMMVWDDLGGDMTVVFLKIFRDLKLSYPALSKNIFITNGWMNYRYHQVGIITTLEGRI